MVGVSTEEEKVKPFGAPAGGRQPFLPGPEGRYGHGSPVSEKQVQQTASMPSAASEDDHAEDHRPLRVDDN